MNYDQRNIIIPFLSIHAGSLGDIVWYHYDTKEWNIPENCFQIRKM
jgi:hypothetical protein